MNVLYLICVCSVATASFNDTESIPLVNQNKAALKADIDFSEFNSKMKNLVTIQVPADIKERFQNYITSEEFKEMVKNEFKQELKDLTKEMVKSMESLNNKVEGQEQTVEHLSSQLMMEKNDSLHAFTSLNQRLDNFQQQNMVTIKALQDQTKENNRRVAFTLCTAFPQSGRSGDVVKFNVIRYQIGINDMSSFIKSFKFKCEYEGLYLISVTITSWKTKINFLIMVNENSVGRRYLDHDSRISHQSSSATVTYKLNKDDVVWVRFNGEMTVYHDCSCLSIVKIH